MDIGTHSRRVSRGKPPLQRGEPKAFSSSISSTTKTAVLENSPLHLKPSSYTTGEKGAKFSRDQIRVRCVSSQFSMPSSAAFHGPRTLPVVLRVLSAWGRAKPACFRDELGLLQSSSDTGHSSWGIKAPVLPRRQWSCPALHTAGIC